MSISRLLFLLALLFASHAQADDYPDQILGAWGGRAEFAGDDRDAVAKQACDSYKKTPKKVTGDVLVFEKNKKLSFGGYVDYADENITVKAIAPSRWQIKDRHFSDGEADTKVGETDVNYEITVDGNILTLRKRDQTSRFSRCQDRTGAREVPLLAFLKGGCETSLAGNNLTCEGKASYLFLDNGRSLINFFTSEITTIGFSGEKIISTGSRDRILYLDHAYINQTQHPADGQCIFKPNPPGPQRLECRALLRDGRRLTAFLTIEQDDEAFLNPPKRKSDELGERQCTGIIKTHGFLSRAQFQCGFSRYSTEMLEASRNCAKVLSDTATKRLLTEGMRTFDTNERKRGRKQLCSDILREFRNFIQR
jgi:hypothetical protein